MLKHDEGFNLYDQLTLLVDPKYKDKSHYDDAWREACDAAIMNLGQLKEEASDGEKKANEIVKALLKVSLYSFSLR